MPMVNSNKEHKRKPKIPVTIPTRIEHNYPLKQIVITLQGAKTSKIEDVIAQLDIIKKRLMDGDCAGFENNDEFGYGFEVEYQSNRLSFFPHPMTLPKQM